MPWAGAKHLLVGELIRHHKQVNSGQTRSCAQVSNLHAFIRVSTSHEKHNGEKKEDLFVLLNLMTVHHPPIFKTCFFSCSETWGSTEAYPSLHRATEGSHPEQVTNSLHGDQTTFTHAPTRTHTHTGPKQSLYRASWPWRCALLWAMHWRRWGHLAPTWERHTPETLLSFPVPTVNNGSKRSELCLWRYRVCTNDRKNEEEFPVCWSGAAQLQP